jgi:hypothetical protein
VIDLQAPTPVQLKKKIRPSLPQVSVTLLEKAQIRLAFYALSHFPKSRMSCRYQSSMGDINPSGGEQLHQASADTGQQQLVNTARFNETKKRTTAKLL